MGAFQRAVITAKGQALMAKVISDTAKFTFTKIAVSDTNNSSADLAKLTEIGTVRQSAAVASVVTQNSSNVKVSAYIENWNLTQGYYVRTIGLYATDPDEGEILYSVAVADESSATADWMPPFNGCGSSSLKITLLTAVSNAADVDIITENVTIPLDELTEVIHSEFNKKLIKYSTLPEIKAGGNEAYRLFSCNVQSDYAGKGIKGIKLVNFFNTKTMRIKQVIFRNKGLDAEYADLSSTISYKADGAGVQTTYDKTKQVLEVTIPQYQGIIIYSPGKQLYDYSAEIVCDISSAGYGDINVYMLDNNMTDGTGQNAAGAHEAGTIKIQQGNLGIYGSTLIMRDYGNDTFQSLVAGAGMAANKPVNKCDFSPYELYLYSPGNNDRANPGSLVKNSVYEAYYDSIDLRYSFNCEQPLDNNRPIYLKGKITDGRFSLSDDMYTQILPSSDDGYVYIYIGEAFGDYNANLSMNNPIYHYKNGCICLYNDNSEVEKVKAELDNVKKKGDYYGICETPRNTGSKEVIIDDFVLEDGVEVTVKFKYEGSYPGTPNLALNVNGTGAKSIFYKGTAFKGYTQMPVSPYYYSYIQANTIYTFKYNDEKDCWEIIGDLWDPLAKYADVAQSLLVNLDIQFNGVSQGSWRGVNPKTINITPAKIAAAEYEEGKWTLQFGTTASSVISTRNFGTYQKIGSLVHIRGFAQLDGTSDVSMGEDLYISGLPFPMRYVNDNTYPNFLLNGHVYRQTYISASYADISTDSYEASYVTQVNADKLKVSFKNDGQSDRVVYAVYIDLTYDTLLFL